MPIIDTNCGPVDYVESGDGPPVLYFHGTGITSDGMLPIEQSIADSGFRLIMPNRPGYGGTPLSGHRTAVDCSKVAASLLDALNIDSACVMGSSGGAAFALSFAVHHSKRATGLVLLCPQLHRWSDKTWLPRQSRWTLPLLKVGILRKVLLKLYAIQFPRLTVDQFLKMEAGSRYESLKDDESVRGICRDSLAAMRIGPRQPGFENDFVVFTTEDILNDGQEFDVPTLVLHDTCDPITPVAHVEWFQSMVPDCRCVPLHAAGHLIWAGPDASVMHERRVKFLERPQNTS